MRYDATRADGQRLALQLADELLAALPPEPTTMPGMLRSRPAPPDRATLAAIYFQTIATVNSGWPAS